MKRRFAVLHFRFGFGAIARRWNGVRPDRWPLGGGNKDLLPDRGHNDYCGELIPTPVGSYSSLLLTVTVASAAALGYRLMKRTYN